MHLVHSLTRLLQFWNKNGAPHLEQLASLALRVVSCPTLLSFSSCRASRDLAEARKDAFLQGNLLRPNSFSRVNRFNVRTNYLYRAANERLRVSSSRSRGSPAQEAWPGCLPRLPSVSETRLRAELSRCLGRAGVPLVSASRLPLTGPKWMPSAPLQSPLPRRPRPARACREAKRNPRPRPPSRRSPSRTRWVRGGDGRSGGGSRRLVARGNRVPPRRRWIQSSPWAPSLPWPFGSADRRVPGFRERSTVTGSGLDGRPRGDPAPRGQAGERKSPLEIFDGLIG